MLPIKLSFPNSFFDEEIRCDYTVSKEMKKVWAVILDLLSEFMRVCDSYNIKYFACAGTILGAVRHKGMIPWDDDIDIMMYRKDYEKLCRIAEQEFKSPYFFQTEDTDKGSARGHAQLRNSLTTGILKGEYPRKYPFNQGIFIDIFPLDNLPNNDEEAESYRRLVNGLRGKYFKIKSLTWHYKPTFRRNLLKLGYTICKHLYYTIMKISYERYYRQYENAAVKYSQDDSCKRLIIAPFFIPRLTYNREDLKDVIYMPFENLSVPVPIGYDNILKVSYGDWHKFVRGGSVHGGVIFDTERPYTEYIEKK